MIAAELLSEALKPAPIAPDPDRACPCNPNTDHCDCPGAVRMGECHCYRYLFQHPDLWGGWPWLDEIPAFERPDRSLDLSEARRRSAVVVGAVTVR